MSPTDDSSIHVCTPTYSHFLDLVVERITSTDGTLDIVVPEEVLAECDRRFDDIRSQPGVTVHPTDSTVSCGIVILESAVLILGFDQANRVISVLQATSSDARRWAIDSFTSIGPQPTLAMG